MTIKKIFLLLIIEKNNLVYIKKFMTFIYFKKKKFFIKVKILLKKIGKKKNHVVPY